MITVSRKQRPDGDMIPCPFCSPDKPKFLSFYLLWSADGYLRIVGHICGPSHFTDAGFREMEERARREMEKETSTQYLLETLPRVLGWLEDMDALAPCDRVQKLRSAFSAQVPSLWRQLRHAVRKQEGRLVVVRKRRGEGPSGMRSSLGGESEYETEVVAQLRGQAFVGTGRNLVGLLTDIRQMLTDVVGDYPLPLSDDHLLEMMLGMGDEQLNAAKSALDAARGNAIRLRQQLVDMASFLGGDNLSGLERWAGHPDADFHFRVRRERGAVTFIVRSNERTTLPLGGLEVPELKHVPA